MDFLVRTKLLLGEDAVEKLKSSKIAVFGLGGVGSFAAEALCRSGVGSFILVDNDRVDISNINRQLIALRSTVGKNKTHIMAERMKDINPDVNLSLHNVFYLDGSEVDLKGCDYVVDAIDTITGKLKLAEICHRENISLISSMGCGNRLDPTQLALTDIYSTKDCPLCKIMRAELKKRSITKLKVVFSKEKPVKKYNINDESILKMPEEKRTRLPGSVSFVPSVAGLIMASEVTKDLIKNIKERDNE